METFSYYVQLDELFKECMKDLSAEEKGLFCKDGLMLKAYKTEKSLDTLWDESKRRVMFVLKDKNTPDGDDTRLWLLDGKNGEASRNLKGGNVGRTGFLPNIARMLYGLVVDTKGYDDLKGEMDKVVEVWNAIPFAFIEAKKRAGYSSVEKEEIEAALSKSDGAILMREIEILNPNIIVCCDAEDTQFDYITRHFEKLDQDKLVFEYKYPRNPYFPCCLWYYKSLKKAVIKSYHPTRLGKREEWIIHERVISPFRQLLTNVNDPFDSIISKKL